MEGLVCCLGTILTALVIVSLLQFPLQIAMIVMGAKYEDDCPVESMIPIYLIVAGATGIVANCCNCGMKYTESGDGEEKQINPLQAVVQLFLFAWFICGNVWIYKNYEPNYNDPTSPNYCDKTLYLFAFWVTTSYYIVFGAVLIIMCLVGLCMGAAA